MCNNPLFAVQYRRLCVDDVEVCQMLDGTLKRFHKGEYMPYFTKKQRLNHKAFEFIKTSRDFDLLKEREPENFYTEIPCGQCMQCRLNNSIEWATRIVCEQKTSKNSFFLTLTYNDDCIPFNSSWIPTLRMTDIQKFLKDLRRYCEYHYNWYGIRHYTASEYGTSTARPHYHMCIFNLPDEVIVQNKPYKCNFQGDIYYTNPILEKIWGNGFVVIGDLNFASAAYVARYVVKKRTGKASKEYRILNIEPEKAMMSKKPGIGGSYYDSFKDCIYEFDKLYLPSGKVVKPPKYFDKRFAIDEPDVLEYIRFGRSLSAERRKELILDATDLEYQDYLAGCEKVLSEKGKKLVRPLE